MGEITDQNKNILMNKNIMPNKNKILNKNIIVGVLAFQGAVSEHIECAKKAMQEREISGDVIPVKTPAELAKCSGLVIPGGESTTINRLMKSSGIFEKIRELGKDNFPIMGTCAGAILLSSQGDEQCKKTGELLGLVDVKINRNAFGRQCESFEQELFIDDIGKFCGVFIRAPLITSVGKNVRILAKLNDKIVAVQQGNIILTCFHPELAGTAIHTYFLKIICKE